eukprot:NODE_2126_length_1505_cov_80.438495_g2024_i0.p1 GENE.NODE_2126_length_1505_cov_80.438495_g2024_i0~~NODE_2126_length_1505_cov_80.438495_g2024_i0.p1  ORF type:complete len:192 (-),score=11.86 NODE_2126_length_1505_cov_80.438495_g2024_i0:564-1139(-)
MTEESSVQGFQSRESSYLSLSGHKDYHHGCDIGQLHLETEIKHPLALDPCGFAPRRSSPTDPVHPCQHNHTPHVGFPTHAQPFMHNPYSNDAIEVQFRGMIPRLPSHESLPAASSSSQSSSVSGKPSRAISNLKESVPSGETWVTACEHVENWRRLRAKRGYVYFVCTKCSAKWRVAAGSARTGAETKRRI